MATAGIIAGMGQFAEQERRRAIDQDEKQRAGIRKNLTWAVENLSMTPLAPMAMQLLGQLDNMKPGQLASREKKFMEAYAAWSDQFVQDRIKDSQSQQNVQNQQAQRTLGIERQIRPAVPTPPPITQETTPGMPGVQLPGITQPLEPVQTPPPLTGQPPQQQSFAPVATPPPMNPFQAQHTAVAEAAAQKFERELRLRGEIAGELSAEQRQAVAEHARSLPGFDELSPPQQFEAMLGAANLQRGPSASFAHLGGPEQFRIKETGEVLTGVPDKASGGYRVGDRLIPFEDTESISKTSASDSAQYMADGLKLAEEQKRSPLTLPERQKARQRLRQEWALAGKVEDPTMAETRRLNLLLMQRILHPTPLDELPTTDQQRIDGIADRWLSGQMTAEQASRSLGSPRANLMPALMDSIQRKGGVILPQSAQKQLEGVNTARTLLREIEMIGEKIMRGEDTMYNTNLMRRKHGTFSVVMARARGEVGTMTEGDVSRAGNLMPGWVQANFTPDWFMKEINWGYQMLNNQQMAIVDFYRRPIGFSPPGGGEKPERGEVGEISDQSKVQRLIDKYK